MDWFYAQDNQQRGPVSEVELTGLVTAGVVTDQTLVWHDGLTAWVPYGQVKPGQPPLEAPPILAAELQVPPPAGEQAICVECGRILARDQTVNLGGFFVCAECKPRHLQKLREGVPIVPPTNAPPANVYAGFWIRFAAKMIDGLILGVVIVVPLVILMMGSILSQGAEARDPMVPMLLQVLCQVGMIAGQVAYNTIFLGKWGATLGKMAVGIRVVNADGRPLTYGRAFGRAWAEVLSRMICSIGYIIAAFDDERRALHDHICNTRVIPK